LNFLPVSAMAGTAPTAVHMDHIAKPTPQGTHAKGKKAKKDLEVPV
jgi:hypothetical protein